MAVLARDPDVIGVRADPASLRGASPRSERQLSVPVKFQDCTPPPGHEMQWFYVRQLANQILVLRRGICCLDSRRGRHQRSAEGGRDAVVQAFGFGRRVPARQRQRESSV